MLQWFMRFPKFIKITEFKESSAPFRKNSLFNRRRTIFNKDTKVKVTERSGHNSGQLAADRKSHLVGIPPHLSKCCMTHYSYWLKEGVVDNNNSKRRAAAGMSGSGGGRRRGIFYVQHIQIGRFYSADTARVTERKTNGYSLRFRRLEAQNKRIRNGLVTKLISIVCCLYVSLCSSASH